MRKFSLFFLNSEFINDNTFSLKDKKKKKNKKRFWDFKDKIKN